MMRNRKVDFYELGRGPGDGGRVKGGKRNNMN